MSETKKSDGSDKYFLGHKANGSSEFSGDNVTGDDKKDVFFIIPRTVHVFYGPYMYLGMMDYRTERLQGLKKFIEKLGVTVVLVPCVDHVNLVRLWFLEEPVFSCKITDLMHGGDGELDPVCWEATRLLEKFIKKVLQALRQTRAIAPEELKRPFCPCFQGNHNQALVPQQHHVASDWESDTQSDSGASVLPQ